MAHCTVIITGFTGGNFSGIYYDCCIQPTGEDSFSVYSTGDYYSLINFSALNAAQVNAQMMNDVRFQVLNDERSNGSELSDNDFTWLAKCVEL